LLHFDIASAESWLGLLGTALTAYGLLQIRGNLANPGHSSRILVRGGLVLLTMVSTYGALRAPRFEIWAALVAAATAAGLIAAFDVLPTWLARRRAARLARRALAGTLKDPGYFRLTPYDSSARDQKAYRRPDGGPGRVLDWILESRSPLLFLTGRSGTGKSSLLAASVLPALERKRQEPWTVVTVRAYADPLREVIAGLKRPGSVWEHGQVPDQEEARALLELACIHLRAKRSPRRLLIVVDQFEEFVIFHEERQRKELEILLRTLVDRPVPGLTVMLVLRSDYLASLEELELPRIRGGGRDNWVEIEAFTEKASREFLSRSGLKIGEGLLEDILREAAELEEADDLVRPITLNFMGTILDRSAAGRPRRLRARRLFRSYLQEAIASRDVREIAPQVLQHMLTPVGTKQPRTVEELVARTDLSRGTVRGCMLQLGNKGLVRCLDAKRDAWEISHDFLAPQLAVAVKRSRMGVWHRLRPWMAPAALTAWLLTSWIGIPLALESLVLRQIWSLGGEVQHRHDGLHIEMKNRGVDLGTLARWLRWEKNLRALDLSFVDAEDLGPLSFLTQLETLSLYDMKVSDLRPLSGLTGLRSLDLSYTPVSDLEPLRPLRNLKKLDLSATKVEHLEPLAALDALESLILDETPIADLTSLPTVSSLKNLSIASTKIRDLEPLRRLNKLQLLNLSKTPVKDFEVLRSLTQLRGLSLNGVQVGDLRPLEKLFLLTVLNVSETPVSDLHPLEKLFLLTTLDISQTAVTDLDPLTSLPHLDHLIVGGGGGSLTDLYLRLQVPALRADLDHELTVEWRR
jgi:hypothetical protein